MNHLRTCLLFFLIVALTTFVIQHAKAQETIRVSDSLSLKKISAHCYTHISHHYVSGFRKVFSNGLLYISGNEALIMDTPPNDALSNQLLQWIKVNYPSVKIKGVVVNHFHSDCLGGLKAFHQASIPSFGNRLTPELLKVKNDPYDAPKNLFEKKLVLKVGNQQVISEYPGQAHTVDNIVSYVAEDNVLFGGCMVKALKAGKGNVADANLLEWSNTVSRVKDKYKKALIIVPGHGAEGDTSLLDFTIKLFR